MPTTLHDREQAFEAKFAHDAELRFLVAARRDKLFAQWAATTLDLSEADAAALTTALLAIPDRASHNDTLLARVAALFAAKAYATAPNALAVAFNDCWQQARWQLMAEPG